jgi:hypothetical protein
MNEGPKGSRSLTGIRLRCSSEVLPQKGDLYKLRRSREAIYVTEEYLIMVAVRA